MQRRQNTSLHSTISTGGAKTASYAATTTTTIGARPMAIGITSVRSTSTSHHSSGKQRALSSSISSAAAAASSLASSTRAMRVVQSTRVRMSSSTATTATATATATAGDDIHSDQELHDGKSSPSSLSSLKHLTIEQYNAKRIQGDLPYNSDVVIQGWVRSHRQQGKVGFLTINDGSNINGVQAIIDPSWTSSQMIEQFTLGTVTFPIGSAVTIKGTMVRNDRKPHESNEGWEIRLHDFQVNGICDIHGIGMKSSTSNQQQKSSSKKAKNNKKNDQKDNDDDNNKDMTNQTDPHHHHGQSQSEPLGDQEHSPLDGYQFGAYPLQKKYQTLPFLRDHPNTRMRTNTYAALQRIRSHAILSFHNHFAQEDFTCIHTPVLTPSDCEGSGEMFQAERSDYFTHHHQTSPSSSSSSDDHDNTKPKTTSTTAEVHQQHLNKDAHFFDRPAYLGVSGQLYAEIAASSLRRVYTFGPTFRAENSHTSRHLAEFWMLEPEMAFADLNDICNACEHSIQSVIKHLLSTPRILSDLEFFASRYDKDLLTRLNHVATTQFGRITYTNAIELLKHHSNEGKVSFTYKDFTWGVDLQTEHEKYLAEVVFQRPVFVTDYPLKLKPFYMRINDDSLVQSASNQPTTSPSTTAHPLSPTIKEKFQVTPNDSISTSSEAYNNYINTKSIHLPTFSRDIMANPDHRATVACFDLLVPGMGELCGGSQREERVEVLLQRIIDNKLPFHEYQWYVDLRRFGTTQHGGWGMGFERFLAYITGIDNIRDTTLVPRAPGLMQI